MSYLIQEWKYELTESEQRAFNLRAEGWCYKDIADMMGKTFYAIRKLLYRADKKIKMKEFQTNIAVVS
jgi:DNA-directed RNA polymerase specialized sigma24 family protein